MQLLYTSHCPSPPAHLPPRLHLCAFVHAGPSAEWVLPPFTDPVSERGTLIVALPILKVKIKRGTECEDAWEALFKAPWI